MIMKKIEQDFEEVRNAINNGKIYVACKYSFKVVKIKQILEIYNEQLAKKYHASDGRNIQFVGDDNSTHWCNTEMMMTKPEAIAKAEQLKQKQQELKRQEKLERIEKLKQELEELEQWQQSVAKLRRFNQESM